MTEVNIYRGAVGPDGKPVLETALWAEDPEGESLPDFLGLHGTWRLRHVSRPLAQTKLVKAKADPFGHVTDPGDVETSAYYDRPIIEGFALLETDTYAKAYAADVKEEIEKVGYSSRPETVDLSGDDFIWAVPPTAKRGKK